MQIGSLYCEFHSQWAAANSAKTHYLEIFTLYCCLCNFIPQVRSSFSMPSPGIVLKCIGKRELTCDPDLLLRKLGTSSFLILKRKVLPSHIEFSRDE